MSIDSLIFGIKYLLWAIVFFLCFLLAWAAVSPFFYGVCWSIEKLGATHLLHYRRLVRLSRLLAWPITAYNVAAPHLPLFEAVPAVRVVIDERLTMLGHAIANSRNAIVSACDKIAQFGERGPAALMADVSKLEQRTNEVAKLGGEIDEGLVKDYQTRANATTSLVIGTLFLLVFALGNGTFINQFMHVLLPAFAFGVPVSLFVSVIIVAFEAGAGFLIGYSTRHGAGKWNIPLFVVSIVAVLGCAAFEVGLVGIMSYNFDLDMPILDTYPALRLWMAPLGAVFALVTAGVSYAVDKLREERGAAGGALRLRREIKQVNAYVRELPLRWETISNRARNAKSALDNYAVALGARDGTSHDDGTMSGLLRDVGEERRELIQALDGAKVESWQKIFQGNASDDRREALRNIGLLGLTAIGVSGATIAYFWFFYNALRDLISLSPTGWIVFAGTFVLSLYVLGFLAFKRLHNVDSHTGRTFPFRDGVAERVASIVIASVVCIALLWAGWHDSGAAGLLVGLLMIAAGAVLVWLGYHFERSVRAIGLVAFALALAAIVAVSGLSGITLFVLCWGLSGVFWLIWLILYVLGFPTERAYAWWSAYRSRRRALLARDANVQSVSL